MRAWIEAEIIHEIIFMLAQSIHQFKGHFEKFLAFFDHKRETLVRRHRFDNVLLSSIPIFNVN